MTKKQKPQVLYVPPATPASAPAQTSEALAAQQSLQQQLQQMRTQYENQLAGLTGQYSQNQTASNSVLATLQASLAKQQEAAMQATTELSRAKDVSSAQAAMLSDARAGGQATYADNRQANLDMNTSLFGRLQRRQQSRQTKY